MKRIVSVAFIFLIVLVTLVACGEEPDKSKADSEEKIDKPYMKLLSITRNHAEDCFDYEYSKDKRDYLTFNFSKNEDALGYSWEGKDRKSVV